MSGNKQYKFKTQYVLDFTGTSARFDGDERTFAEKLVEDFLTTYIQVWNSGHKSQRLEIKIERFGK